MITPQFLQSILVASSDKKLAKAIIQLLAEYHKIEAVKATDGDAAWLALKDKTFDYLVLDWQLDKLSSVTLFNRLRQNPKYQTMPVLVVSSLTQKENFTVLNGSPFTEMLLGVFSNVAFSIKHERVIKEAAWYFENKVDLAELMPQFKADPTSAYSRFSAMAKAAPNSVAIFNIMAKQCREMALYNAAERLLAEAAKKSDNSFTVLEQAKIYHQSGSSDVALELIERKKLSTKSVEKWRLQGEIHLALKDPNEALKMFGRALDIDPANEACEKGAMIADRLIKFYETKPQNLPSQFLSIVELAADQSIKAGKPEEAIVLYRAVLDIVYKPSEKAQMLCCIGIIYAATNNKAEALKSFKESEALDPAFPKASEQIKLLQGGKIQKGAA